MAETEIGLIILEVKNRVSHIICSEIIITNYDLF